MCRARLSRNRFATAFRGLPATGKAQNNCNFPGKVNYLKFEIWLLAFSSWSDHCK